MTTCPACNESHERVAQHWAMSGCGYPEISDGHRDILDGIVLAGGTVAGNGNNRHLQIGTTVEPLAEWLAEQLDWLCQAVRCNRRDGDWADQYQVRTPAHPSCNRYERWDHIGHGTRTPPDDYQLTPRAARVWWAFAGGLQWSGPYDSQITATISALEDRRAASIHRVISTVPINIDPTRAGKRIQWSGPAVDEWLEWVGASVPGVEHKWAESLVEYRTLRDRPQTETEYRVALCRHALAVARERTDKRLTAELFDRRVDDVDAEVVADVLGGGDFEDALSVAGVSPQALAHNGGKNDDRN